MGCYRVSNNTLIDITYKTFVCDDVSATGVSTCCALGSVCLDQGVCHDSGSAPGLSGYYTAACTDSTFKDTACPQRCSGQPRPDIVYNTADSLWSCCGFENNNVTCANPTDETFQIFPPKVLLATTIGSAASGTQATATSSSNSTSSDPSAVTTTGSAESSIPSSPSSSDASTSGLSTGAKAGIGVGVTLGVFLVLALLGWFILRRRRRKTQASNDNSNGLGSYPPKKMVPFGKAELEEPRVEMEDSNRTMMLAELGNDRYSAHELHGLGRSELPSDNRL